MYNFTPSTLLCLNVSPPTFAQVKDAYTPLPMRKPILGSFYRSKKLLPISSVLGGATARRVCYKPDIIQATGTSQVQSPKLFSLLHVSFTLCRQRQLLRGMSNGSSLCEALPRAGNITAAFVEQLICTGISVIKSRRWLQCYSPTAVRKATRQGLPRTI